MKLISIVLNTLTLAGLSQGLATFTNCATGPTVMAVTSFAVIPEPLCINHNMCATATGTLSDNIWGQAKYVITGRYLGRLVYTDNHDLCAILDLSGRPCPIPKTVTSLTTCTLVKPNAPSNIAMAMTFLATNGDGNTIYCQSATLTAVQCP
ncbi:MAG: hypothetical protein JOS17DRAFT_787679 [Linnemannia elongata]|nr:MAG: hypothetical protein JOS17DRAFT_787679 [Linnemannia elongata]